LQAVSFFGSHVSGRAKGAKRDAFILVAAWQLGQSIAWGVKVQPGLAAVWGRWRSTQSPEAPPSVGTGMGNTYKGLRPLSPRACVFLVLWAVSQAQGKEQGVMSIALEIQHVKGKQ